MRNKISLASGIFLLTLLLTACSKDDSSDEVPEEVEEPNTSQTLPSWGLSTFQYIKADRYNILLMGTTNPSSGHLNQGILYNTRGNPTLENNLNTSIHVLSTRGRIGGEFTITFPELLPNTTYHFRTYRQFEDRTDYGGVFSITTGARDKHCSVQGHDSLDLVTGRSATFRNYYYDDLGRLIFKSKSSIVHPGLSSSGYSHLYRYSADQVYRTELRSGEAIEEKLKGSFKDEKLHTWITETGEFYYEFSYPDEQTVVLQRFDADMAGQESHASDSIVYHIDAHGNVEFRRSYSINPQTDSFELNTEHRYSYSDLRNAFKGNLDHAFETSFFSEKFLIKVEYRQLPDTEFRIIMDRPADSREDNEVIYIEQGLKNIVTSDSCD